jgi:hypothetical protein
MAGKTLTNGDRLLLTLAIFSLVILYAVFWGRSVYGNQASIAVGGKHWSTVDLYQNRTIDVKGEIGVSRLEVKDGRIRFVHSPCDTQQCVHQG